MSSQVIVHKVSVALAVELCVLLIKNHVGLVVGHLLRNDWLVIQEIRLGGPIAEILQKMGSNRG